MKGAIFIALNEMIENNYSMAFWEDLLDEVQPKSQGVYTSTQNYDAEEAAAFIRAISRKTGMATADIARSFGMILFSELDKKFPIFARSKNNLFDFLCSIEDVIHKEVRKLFDKASLPTLDCKLVDENTLEMKYYSDNKMCFLAEGLIHGAAEYYKTKIVIAHPQCIHNNQDYCIINIRQN